jgi:hypothetical protein
VLRGGPVARGDPVMVRLPAGRQKPLKPV